MLYPLWTAKPGSGCSTTSLALATRLAARHRTEVLLVDLGGDLAAATGVTGRPDGVTDWLAAEFAPVEALARLEHDLSPRLRLLLRGEADLWSVDRAERLIVALAQDRRAVVVDVSTVDRFPATAMQHLRRRLAEHDPSLLVTRPCYLAMRRAEAVDLRPTGLVLLREPGRSLDRSLVERALGAPVVASIDHDPAVARAVDAGTFVRRPPRPLGRQIDALVR